MFTLNHYTTSVKQSPALDELEFKMRQFYNSLQYHKEWIDGHNKAWTDEHRPQLAAAAMIPPRAILAEIGCGAGDAKEELQKRIPGLRYIGIDLNWRLWPGQSGFVSASATTLPLANESADAVLSMYVIEHICRPRDFLDEAWRIAKQAVIVIAPDFSSNPMPSEWAGFSYGAGRDKMANGRVADALLTGVANRFGRISRFIRTSRLRSGKTDFPVLLNPRCLGLPGFVPDCDAIYPVHPTEIRIHYSKKKDFRNAEVFYNDGFTFGAIYEKRH